MKLAIYRFRLRFINKLTYIVNKTFIWLSDRYAKVSDEAIAEFDKLYGQKSL